MPRTDALLHGERAIAVRDEFMDVSGVGRRRLLVPQHDDQRDQHDHDGANYDQLCGQRDDVPAFHPDTGDPLHDESVIAVREELNLHLNLPRDCH